MFSMPTPNKMVFHHLMKRDCVAATMGFIIVYGNFAFTENDLV